MSDALLDATVTAVEEAHKKIAALEGEVSILRADRDFAVSRLERLERLEASRPTVPPA